MKEYEKKDKYLDLARELKKLWNMKVTIVPIVIGAFGTITKGLLKGLEESIAENDQNPEESWRLEQTCCHSNSTKKSSANTDVNSYNGVKNNNCNP